MEQVLNIDGFVGPSHHYAGLSEGNLASTEHKGDISSPRTAALQGLEKMWLVHQLGTPQAFFPPQQRPHLKLLHALGFSGTPRQILKQLGQNNPQLLHCCYSASSMWAANCATVTASADSTSGLVHLTPANLISTLHRSLEAEESHTQLKQYFSNSKYFQIHPPLPAQASFSDEGAANHIRLSDPNSDDALNLFIYGKKDQLNKQRYISRQSLSACQSIIRRHNLKPDKCLLIQQNPIAIDNGAFHNDVVAVGLNNLLIIHEQAWKNQTQVLRQLKQRTQHWQQPLYIFQVSNQQLSLSASIDNYLFNSQLVSLPQEGIALIAPEESQESKAAYALIKQLIDNETPLTEVHFVNLRESMKNGGGPACLRLAIPLSQEELSAVDRNIMLTKERYSQLKNWISHHYREQLTVKDLQDPLLLDEISEAFRALIPILNNSIK